MTLGQLALVAEIVGGIGVVASLIYLALEIRRVYWALFSKCRGSALSHSEEFAGPDGVARYQTCDP